MKICMVSQHACIRVFKQAQALKEKGHTVHSMAMQDSMGWNIYDSYSRYLDKETCGRLVRMYEGLGVDIFHVHNEPDILVKWVRDFTDKPIVYDCHDLQSLRTLHPPDIHEQNAFALADAVVHVSASVQTLAETQHGEKKSIVLKSYVNKSFIPDTEKIKDRCRRTIVYQGGVASIATGPGNYKNYRYYVPMVQAFDRLAGYHVYLFSATHGLEAAEYIQAGAIISGPHPYPAMMQALQLHGLGFVGACIDVPIMQAALPNKLFEYISQGVVPVVMFSKECADFVNEHDCGIVLDGSFENLPDQIKDAEKKRQNLFKIHDRFVMEDQVGKLEELYADLKS